jgi:hypothetical protein
VADKIRADAEAARIESEWKFAAMVRQFFFRVNKLSSKVELKGNI